MKFKFFITVFLALSMMAVTVSSIHHYFFKLERLRLIELNLQQNLNLLQNSDLNMTRTEFSHKGKELIGNIIGDDKINMIVGIYNAKGSVLYKNENADIFNLEDRISPEFKEWEDVETRDYFIKYLTAYDHDQKRIVRVGMILNQSLLRWKDLNQRILILVGLLLVFVSLVSFILTQALFRPVSQISKDIILMASKIGSGEFEELRSWFSSKKESQKIYRDEFYGLLSSLDHLALKITENQMQMQKWAALMAHELKTPMTRLKNSVDGYSLKKEDRYLRAIESELLILETIVMDFLAWASLENDQSRPEIHAVSMKKKLLSILHVFQIENPEFGFDVDVGEDEDFKIFCTPLHFEQLLTNLLSNSVKYSTGQRISVRVERRELILRDFGEGIPQGVLDNFGKPFNRDKAHQHEGHGLGLAWVKTICNKYDWRISIANDHGTLVSITFQETYG